MKKRDHWSGTCLFFVLFFCFPSQEAFAAEISLLVIDANSYLTNLTVDQLEPEDRGRIHVFGSGELHDNSAVLKKEISDSSVIVVDVMGRELEEYLNNNIDIQGKTVYALRGSNDDEQLKKLGYIFDATISEYYSHISRENISNMLRLVMHRHIDATIDYEPVKPDAQKGIYHPDANALFTASADYQQWLAEREGYAISKPHLGLLFFSSFLTPGQKQPVDDLIHRFEAEGFTVYPCFGKDLETIRNFFFNEEGKANIDLLLAYSLKFYSALNPELAETLVRLDVPIISAVSLYQDTLDEWRESPVGIANQEIAWSMAAPELSGLVEPTVLSAKKEIIDKNSGKRYTLNRMVEENLDRLLPRLHRWIGLQRKENKEKKVAILYYNHNQGKQNIGASYLNVFRSTESILSRLDEEGYYFGEQRELSEGQIKKHILDQGRNIGSWAPGELDKLIAAGGVIRLKLTEYQKWFQDLPARFKEKVLDQWGTPAANGIMMDGDRIILPMIQLGNIVLMPEPAKGWGDEPDKLYHDNALSPHHQYIAAYLWLQKRFRADAMIHLGTHATYEWTPGKQAGLSPSCSPEVLISDIPNLYPYIVDNVGEALQAKRRGRGVMIFHLPPPAQTLRTVPGIRADGRAGQRIPESGRPRFKHSSGKVQ